MDSHQRHIADLTDDYEKQIAEEYMSRQTLVEEKEELVRAFQMTKDVIEEDADREIEDLKSRYDI